MLEAARQQRTRRGIGNIVYAVTGQNAESKNTRRVSHPRKETEISVRDRERGEGKGGIQRIYHTSTIVPPSFRSSLQIIVEALIYRTSCSRTTITYNLHAIRIGSRVLSCDIGLWQNWQNEFQTLHALTLRACWSCKADVYLPHGIDSHAAIFLVQHLLPTPLCMFFFHFS